MIDRSFQNWIINLIRFCKERYFSNNSKRKRNIWAFSAWEGNKYADNTRYFYEYVKNKNKNIRCIWFTNNTDVFQQLKIQGDEVYIIGTEESKEMQMKAGVAFYTNGIDDFGIRPYIFGAVIVSLWHGVGFKRIYGSEIFKKCNRILTYIRRVKNSFFYWTYRDITFTTSRYMKEKAIEQFYITKKNKVFITGQPRNDIFQLNLDKNKILFNCGLKRKKSIITFMPTWQSFNDSFEIRDMLEKLDKDRVFIDFLKTRNYQFLVKLHYLSKNESSYNNIVKINDNDISSTQELLAITDILITDYSSVYADFALLNRPIIFFRPDSLNEMSEFGQYDDFKIVCKVNLAKNYCELSNMIKKIINGKYDYSKQNEIINQFFNDKETVCGLSAERIYNIVLDNVNESKILTGNTIKKI